MTVHYMADYRGINRRSKLRSELYTMGLTTDDARAFCTSMSCTVIFKDGRTLTYSVLSGEAHLYWSNSMDFIVFKPISVVEVDRILNKKAL